MKIQPRCTVCLFQRALNQIKLATEDTQLQFKVLKEIVRLFADELNENAISAVLGTKRDRIIRRLTNCPDPYKEHKIKSNEIALEMMSNLIATLEQESDAYKRFRFTMLASIVGNILEFDILEHSMDLDDPNILKNLLISAEQDLVVDQIEEIFLLARSVQEVLFLTDNAGEIVFDRLLIQEMLNLGIQVIVAVKASPVLNDATLEDAKVAGLICIAESNPMLRIITTGTDHVGLLLDDISDPFRTIFGKAPFIIAKGMGYYETLADRTLPQPVAYLFRTKCSTVAEDLGVPLNKNLALLQNPVDSAPNKI
ncbi:MAG: DUF89 family protein [Promethearchaeota archaeon]|nr:MAG: DUF89 family protein [Candidatus Lokiarchaeota archaeon]